MTRKEDVERVRQIVKSANEIKKRQADDQGIAETSRMSKELQKKGDSEAGIRATGIVDLFEAIRDEEVVRGSYGGYGYSPADVEVQGCMVSIRFDIFRTNYHLVEARLEDGLLVVEGEEKMIVGKNLGMADAVGKAIANPRHIEPVLGTDLGWD